MQFKIPKEVQTVMNELLRHSHQAFLVGGCVRDLFLERRPADWDVATDARPEEIQKIFKKSIYENQFGTVAVFTGAMDLTLKVVEITTFRSEGRYSDQRHPDEVRFAKTIEEDLARRDFTVNAMALGVRNGKWELRNEMKEVGGGKNLELVDPFHGHKDLSDKLIRAVGEPEERFYEDALRLARAVRLSVQLGFEIEEKTTHAVKNQAGSLKNISQERIRDELTKILETKKAAVGIQELHELGLLKYILPELEEGVGVTQNKHHRYTVFDHNLRCLDYSVKKNYSIPVKIAALLHDIGKPRTKRGQGDEATFYAHQVVGEKMVRCALRRLCFPKEIVEKVTLLIREHMFVYDPETVTLSGVRRLLRRVGWANIGELLQLRQADRIGSGVPKAQPYRLRYLQAMLEKVQTDPIDPSMLKVGGHDVMQILKIKPSPKVGWVLSILLDEVLEDPRCNREELLKERVIELGELSDEELKERATLAKKSASAAQARIDQTIKEKYFVR